MAQHNFGGDIDGISDQQLAYVDKVLSERGFKNSKVTFAPVGKAGDNYLSTVKRITIAKENEIITMIAKFAPTNETLRNFLNSALFFKNEHIMYNDVLPKFVQLQKDADVPEKEQLKYAKCYGSSGNPPHEVILLEDLKSLDFIMLDRFVPLSNDCIKSVLKNFAIFHSLSYVLKHKQPNFFNEFKSNLTDMWATQIDNAETRLYFEALEAQTVAVLDGPKHINLVRHKMSRFLDMCAKFGKVDYDTKYSVILQGDAWTNNIMFRFENDTLAESIMIDYQISKVGSPVYDIMYLIFACTDHDTRRKHYHDWVDYYHSELERSLSNYDLKANLIYPRDKLDADLQRYGKFVFGLSINLASIMTRKSEDAAKIMELMGKEKSENTMERAQDMGIANLDEESINLFKSKISELLESFTEFGLL